MSTPIEFYAISKAKFRLIIYFILLKICHEITKIYQVKVGSTGIIVWPLKNRILSDR